MSCGIDQPSEVQAQQVTQNRLRHEGQIPRFRPEINGNHCWNDEAEKNFQRNEVSGNENDFVFN